MRGDYTRTLALTRLLLLLAPLRAFVAPAFVAGQCSGPPLYQDLLDLFLDPRPDPVAVLSRDEGQIVCLRVASHSEGVDLGVPPWAAVAGPMSRLGDDSRLPIAPRSPCTCPAAAC